MRRPCSLLALSLLAVTLTDAQTHNTPLQHVIVIVQENRTPTNLFGNDTSLVSAGFHLATTELCGTQTITPTSYQLDACFSASHAHQAWVTAYHKGKLNEFCAISSGVNNCTPQQQVGIPTCTVNNQQVLCPEYTYVDNSTGLLNPYFQLAAQYGFANYMFQTNQGPSFPAHQFLFSGTSAPVAYPTPFYDWFLAENNASGGGYGCTAVNGTVIKEVSPSGTEAAGYTPPDPPSANAGFPCYDHNTLVDLFGPLGAPTITWKYYGTSAGSLWMAPNAIDHICKPSGFAGTCMGAPWKNGNVSTNPPDVLSDLGVNGTGPSSCNLPQVTWVTPDGHWSDHPGTVGHDGGPSWVSAIVNAVGGYDNSGKLLSPANGNGYNCGYWPNTAILVTWDDWGGFFDDIDPVATMSRDGNQTGGYPGTCTAGVCNGTHYVYGFRVPLLVVSPYAKAGYISGGGIYPPTCPSSYCHDFGSILNFIEYVFGTNGNSLGTIGPSQWPYADFFAQDTGPAPNNYSLYDFFDFKGQIRTFTPITSGVKYQDNCFFSPRGPGCFTSFVPAAPDDDSDDIE